MTRSQASEPSRRHGLRPLAVRPPAHASLAALLALALGTSAPAAAQEEAPPSGPAPAAFSARSATPADAASDDAPIFHTFSIAAVDPFTGEVGVAVTTRVACVGNIVPHVRAGVGAVATQARSRIEYGVEVLDFLEAGLSPREALRRAVEADTGRAERQVGVVAAGGATAQHTGDETIPWAGHRSGDGFAVQGNLLVGPEVVEAVAERFEASAGEPRHLADRLIEAIEAGEAAGGDARRGRLQSAALVVADGRDGVARRPDGTTADIHVCEHPQAVAELRRVYETISGTLGWRTLQQYSGNDVVQLKRILHALGYYRPDAPGIAELPDLPDYDRETMEAVEAFRADFALSTTEVWSPLGLVDRETVERMSQALEERGLHEQVRRDLLELTAIRR